MGVFIIIAIVVFLIWINSGSSSSSSRSSYNSTRQNTTYTPPPPPPTIPSIQKKTTAAKPTSTSSSAPTTKTAATTKAPPSLAEKHRLASNFEKLVKESVKPTFTPTSGIGFQISNTSGQYNWYAIYNYYPVNRFSASELTSKDLEARKHVYDFKDGRNPDHYSKLFASALVNKFGSSFLSDKILIVVPASSKSKTEVRFKSFCSKMSLYTGMTNGYDMLTNNDVVRTAAHAGGNRNANLEQFLKISGSFAGKNILVIDDVRTSGSSSNKIHEILKSRNAASVTFCYLAKTVSAF
jgi:hypothetical protein